MPNNDILLYENPMYGMQANPHRRRHHRRNPGIGGAAKKVYGTMFGGLKIEEMVAAVAGFALCAMVPGYIITNPDTQLKKAGKIGISLAFAVVAKMILGRWKPGAGNAALYGGIAGTGALAFKMWMPTTNIINAASPRRLPASPAALPVTPSSPSNLGRNTQNEFIPANQL